MLDRSKPANVIAAIGIARIMSASLFTVGLFGEHSTERPRRNPRCGTKLVPPRRAYGGASSRFKADCTLREVTSNHLPCNDRRRAHGAPPTAAPLGRHGRQIKTNRHVLDQFLLGNLLLHLEPPVFDVANVAVDNPDVILLADQLVSLRINDRVLHLHAFQRLDHALDILAGLIAGGFHRLFNREYILPALPGMTLVHYALAAELARMDVVDLDQLVVLAVKFVILGLEHAGEGFEEVGPLGRACDIIGVNRFDAGRLREHLYVLL